MNGERRPIGTPSRAAHHKHSAASVVVPLGIGQTATLTDPVELSERLGLLYRLIGCRVSVECMTCGREFDVQHRAVRHADRTGHLVRILTSALTVIGGIDAVIEEVERHG